MIDLHMHSTWSDDGQFAPEMLAAMAEEAGLEAMSVTDHNCARANAKAWTEAARCGIRYICGIEVDCTLDGVNLHLLGYGIDLDDAGIAAIEQNVRSQAAMVSRERREKLAGIGLAVEEESLPPLESGEWTGEIFAEVLLADPAHAADPRLMPYREGGERSDRPLVNFYWDYCSQGKPAYAHMEYPAMEEAVQVIHSSGGIAVLAHPGANCAGRDELVTRAISLGLDGIEAYTSYHLPDQAARYARIAEDNGLFVTCGSDFHGKTKPDVRLGGHGAPLSYTLPDVLAGLAR